MGNNSKCTLGGSLSCVTDQQILLVLTTPSVSQLSEFEQLFHNSISLHSEDDRLGQDHSSTSPDPVLPAPELSPFFGEVSPTRGKEPANISVNMHIHKVYE